ncbi:MAG: hypothetical protein ACLS8W_07785 [Faecalibacterium prausnitzii]
MQMNYNAAHFRKEVLVRLTLRASYYEKILRSAFPPPPDAFSPKPSLAPSRIPAFALTSPWAGRQATLHEFCPQILRAHTFCVPGGRSAPLCTRSKMTAAPALAVSKIAGEKTKTGGMLYEKMQPVLSQWTVVFSCCGAELFYRRESLYGGGMALPWLRLFVSGCFAAEKIKHSCSPGGKRTTGAAILCGARSYSR